MFHRKMSVAICIAACSICTTWEAGGVVDLNCNMPACNMYCNHMSALPCASLQCWKSRLQLVMRWNWRMPGRAPIVWGVVGRMAPRPAVAALK